MRIEKMIAVIDGKRYELKRDVSCFSCALRVDCGLKGIPHIGDFEPCDFKLYGYRKIKEESK